MLASPWRDDHVGAAHDETPCPIRPPPEPNAAGLPDRASFHPVTEPIRALGIGLAPRVGEALGVDRREAGLDAGGRRFRGRTVDAVAEASGTTPDEEVVRCMPGVSGGSGIMTRPRSGTTSARLGGDGGSAAIEEASERQ